MLFSFIGKLALRLGYGSNSSRPKHVCLKMSSKISVPCQGGHLTVIEKAKQNETNGFKGTYFEMTVLSKNDLCLW